MQEVTATFLVHCQTAVNWQLYVGTSMLSGKDTVSKMRQQRCVWGRREAGTS